MSTQTENRCYRCKTNCTPLANLCADDPSNGHEPTSFICVGYNLPQDREIPADRFSLCWKNDVIDEHGHWDRRDLLDTMSVIAQALSTDENIRVTEGLTEEEMQTLEMR